MTEPEQEQEPTPSSASELTIAEAARATGASERTLRRKLHADALPGARMVEGRWLIPATALLAAGYRLTDPEPTTAPTIAQEPDSTERAPDGWLLERADLEKRAELAEQRANAAEALATERLVRLERTESNLARALAAIPAPTPAEPEHVIVESASQRRRWWQRSE